MAVVRADARLIDSDGAEIGAGSAAIHLPLGRERTQQASGTLSLRRWSPAVGVPAALLWEDGTRLPIQVSRDAVSDCSRSRILRFTAAWPAADHTTDRRG